MAKVRVRIKELGEQRACDGLHFGMTPAHGINPGVNPFRRKLEPGEVVEFDEDDELFQQIWDVGVLEMTRDMPTRPLDFASAREAEVTSASFIPISAQDERDVEDARRAVHARLFPELTREDVALGRDHIDAKTRQRRRQVAMMNSTNEDVS